MADDRASGGPMTEAQQAALRDLLAEQRTEATAQLSMLARDLARIIEGAADVATDDEHDPEGQTIAFERAQVVALLEQARGRLAELGEAEERLADGTYGVCERCGRRIPLERLAARPAARRCVACASVRR